MRISSDPDHPDYHEAFMTCRVWLEGAERNNVVRADEEGRFAVTYRLDEFGKPVTKGGEILTDNFTGHVRIDCPAWVRYEIEARQKR